MPIPLKKPHNFAWIKKDEIAGSSVPTGPNQLLWLKSEGIKHILCLSEVSNFAWSPTYNLTTNSPNNCNKYL